VFTEQLWGIFKQLAGVGSLWFHRSEWVQARSVRSAVSGASNDIAAHYGIAVSPWVEIILAPTKTDLPI
jgi:hypothetical protein